MQRARPLPKARDVIRKPASCTSLELDEFYRVVVEGDQVVPAGLRQRISDARLLAFHYRGTLLAAVAALKSSGEGYKNKVFREAGVTCESHKFHTELGWAITLKEYREKGICTRLIKKLFRRIDGERVFATTRHDNAAMQRILAKCGFQRMGRNFEGKLQENLQLWVLDSQQEKTT